MAAAPPPLTTKTAVKPKPPKPTVQPKPPQKPKEKPKTQAELSALAEQKYGWALAVLMAIPDLKKIFLQAVQEGWEAPKFVARVQSTRWFKTNAEASRKWQILKIRSPKDAATQLAARKAQIQDTSVQLTGVYLTDAQAMKVAEDSLKFNWNDAQIRNTLSGYLKQVGGTQGHYGGDAGAAEQELRQYASDQGITLSDATIGKWLKGIVAQRDTVQDYKSWIQGQAESAYGALGPLIKSGKTVRQLANPYIEEMAQTLELNPAMIDLKDPTIANALQWANPDGKTGMRTLGDFRRALKQDPRWMKTKQATSDATDIGNEILKNFGLIG